MKIEKTAIAGTVESSDIQITITSNPEDCLVIELESQVIEQFGKQITKVINAVLERYQITSGRIIAIDKGALDCVIEARLEAAIHRSLGIANTDAPWEGKK